MSRLIDADKLKQYINDCKHCGVCESRSICCDRECELPDFLTSIWEEVIDQQPTAYDVEKVVEEIEMCEHVSFDKVPMIDMNDAINIVNRGGVG